MADNSWADALDTPFFPEDDTGQARRLRFLGYFPCPIRGQIRTLLHQLVLDRYTKADGGGTVVPWYVPGGCGGKDAYEDLWKVTDPADLPEVILSIDFGDFWRPEFRQKFVDQGLFEPVGPAELSPGFQLAGLAPNAWGYSPLAVFPTVLLVDKTKLGGRPVPTRWSDLLDPMWKDELTLGGGSDSVSTTVLLHFWKDHGDSGLTALAANVRALRHSAQMAKLSGSGHPDATAICVLPWFFADSCPHEKTLIVVPKEGALVSPIYVLAQKNRGAEARVLLDTLFSPEVAAICRENWFPTAVPTGDTGPDRSVLDELRLNWLGWDFLLGQDLTALKTHVEAHFRSTWKGVTG